MKQQRRKQEAAIICYILYEIYKMKQQRRKQEAAIIC